MREMTRKWRKHRDPFKLLDEKIELVKWLLERAKTPEDEERWRKRLAELITLRARMEGERIVGA